MRVHFLIGSILLAASLAAQASEPIVVLEYGQRGEVTNMPMIPEIIHFA